MTAKHNKDVLQITSSCYQFYKALIAMYIVSQQSYSQYFYYNTIQ